MLPAYERTLRESDHAETEAMSLPLPGYGVPHAGRAERETDIAALGVKNLAEARALSGAELLGRWKKTMPGRCCRGCPVVDGTGCVSDERCGRDDHGRRYTGSSDSDRLYCQGKVSGLRPRPEEPLEEIMPQERSVRRRMAICLSARQRRDRSLSNIRLYDMATELSLRARRRRWRSPVNSRTKGRDLCVLPGSCDSTRRR